MKQMKKNNSSFRDPSGFLFTVDGQLYRQVNNVYKENYELLHTSGLYDLLVNKGLLISHEEIKKRFSEDKDAYLVIKPEKVDFISYPYEWSFSQLKDAALVTLQIQKIALEHGMSLKDGSAYNIQWHKGKFILIDTLSFEKYEEGKPWVAYKQFCQHFFAPLILMKYKDIRLSQLLRVYIDGIPLNLASMLLPKYTYGIFSVLSHIHLHAKSQKRYASKDVRSRDVKITKFALESILNNLESFIKKMTWQPKGTEWGDYYTFTNYSDDSFDNKKEIINGFLQEIKPKNVWDVGGNTGEFSRIASDMDIDTVCFDIDEAAVEKNYLITRNKKEIHILPLVLDLTNPSAAIGWGNIERMSLTERGSTDTIIALALIHHLAISNNLPFDKIASFFSSICNSLIIEFVPKNDSQVKKLLKTREDIFIDYTEEQFVHVFGKYFKSIRSSRVSNSARTIYLMYK